MFPYICRQNFGKDVRRDYSAVFLFSW